MTDQPKKKRKKPFAATAHALAECRKRGWDADKVEQRLPRCFITKDLFGCIDILAMTESTFLGLQVTAGDNHAARKAKAMAEPRLRRWLQLGGRFAIWSYDKRGAAGARKLYQLREEEITLQDLWSAAEPLEAGEGPADDAGRDQAKPVEKGVAYQAGLGG